MSNDTIDQNDGTPQGGTICDVASGIPDGANGGGGSAGVVTALSTEHAAKIWSSGIDPMHAVEVEGWRTEADNAVLCEYMGRKFDYGSALVFPFTVPGTGKVIGHRIRPSEGNARTRVSEHGKTTVIKYDQKWDTEPMVYFPLTVPVAQWADVNTPLVITEGELKATLLATLGMCALALTGVYNFVDSKKSRGKGKLAKLNPLLAEHVKLQGRRVVIVYDADSRANGKQVAEAARGLAHSLVEAGAAEVLFAAPPVVDGDQKTGIDDYFAHLRDRGEDAKGAVIEVLRKAFRFDIKETNKMVSDDSNVLMLRGDERTLSVAHANKLQFGDITAETFLEEGWYSETDDRALCVLLGNEGRVAKFGGGRVVPHYRPGEEAPHAYKVWPNRPQEAGRGNGRYTKFTEVSKGIANLIYWPRQMAATAYRNGVRFPEVVVTTSEAAAVVVAVGLGMPAIALSHRMAWQGEEGNRLHPDLVRFLRLEDRRIVVVHESGALGIDSAERSVRRFAGYLKEAGAASVRYTCVPTTGGRRRNIEDLYAQTVEAGDDGAACIREMLSFAEEVDPISPKSPGLQVRHMSALSVAPIDQDLVVPPGYDIDALGRLICKVQGEPGEAEKTVIVARGAIWPMRYLREVSSGSYSTEVAFVGNNNEWRKVLVDRVAIVDKMPMIKTFGKLGGPVASHTAAGLVRWIDDFFVYNPNLPESKLVRRAGWHTSGSGNYLRFMTNEAIVKEGVDDELLVDDRDSEGMPTGIYNKLRPAGCLEDQLPLLRQCADSCLVVNAAINASFATPLLRPLGLENFAVLVGGESSKGKTATLQVAASIWGNPSHRGAGLIAAHKTTEAGAEQRAVMFSDLPLFYDEVKKENNGEQFVYDMVNSGGKGKGTPSGRPRPQEEWFTILQFTGEHDLLDQSRANTGARTRLLKFSPTWSELARLSGKDPKDRVKEIKEELMLNYGNLGRDWLRRLMDLDWDKLKARHQYYSNEVFGGDVTNGTGQRFAAYFATLAITEELVSGFYGLGLPDAGYTRLLWQGFDKDVDQAHERAARVLLDSINGEPSAWPQADSPASADGNALVPKNVIYGFLKGGGGHQREKRTAMAIPSGMRTVMDKFNIPWDSVAERWLEDGVLDGETGGRNGRLRPTKKVTVSRTGIRSRFYVCDLDKVEELAERCTAGN